ncbi:hypothetical protein [Bradyrhizobium sp. JYMT SZCCT0428]|uniref:hypothetical protein n=1 Tax=Bradyrhizobium sp. JYMT SZCCT0428 TaxID=2807673 RepID=UPI001BA5319B|nr:hypothetical protein [Bradyrhizobium sp. JYMT SZCCT0428]MBR1151710.1 hypothetical protein [Bradyrhizobium sp. JYMT SZCCT0428]
MIIERAANAIIGAGARQQRIDLLDRGLCPAEPEFEGVTHRDRKLVLFEQLLNRPALKRGYRAAL